MIVIIIFLNIYILRFESFYNDVDICISCILFGRFALWHKYNRLHIASLVGMHCARESKICVWPLMMIKSRLQQNCWRTLWRLILWLLSRYCLIPWLQCICIGYLCFFPIYHYYYFLIVQFSVSTTSYILKEVSSFINVILLYKQIDQILINIARNNTSASSSSMFVQAESAPNSDLKVKH